LAHSPRGNLSKPPQTKGLLVKIKTLLLTLALSLSFTVAQATPTCSSTKYKLVYDGVSFNETENGAYRKLKRTFGRKAHVRKVQGNIMVAFKKPYKNLDTIAYSLQNGRVTRIIFSYHNNFIASLGGLKDSLMTLLKASVEKYGKADNVDTSEVKTSGKISAVWAEDNGGQLIIVGKDPSTLIVRVDCNALEKHLQEEATKSANFGF
jgi:hypothetical protein